MKTTKVWLAILSTFLIISTFSCQTTPTQTRLQQGDLLFCSYVRDGLSGAIDQVTQTREQTHFSHVGIVSIQHTDTFVLHASTQKGVCKQPLHQFLKEQEAIQVVAYRLETAYLTRIDSVLEAAEALVGLPYNFAYLPDDSSYYCSQLIYSLFKNQEVFTLEPMTFKDPETGEFNPTWVEHYAKIGVDIPEGKPGCNPNGLAASDKLRSVLRIR